MNQPSETVRHAHRLLDLAAETNWQVTEGVAEHLLRAAVLFEMVEEHGPAGWSMDAVEATGRAGDEARARFGVWNDPIMLDYWRGELEKLDLIVRQARNGFLFVPEELELSPVPDDWFDGFLGHLGPPVDATQVPLMIRYPALRLVETK